MLAHSARAPQTPSLVETRQKSGPSDVSSLVRDSALSEHFESSNKQKMSNTD
jgi:hypothetical protein